MSKRGTIGRTVRDVQAEYENSMAPRTGFFSTLDELVQQAPFERGSEEQWRSYLKPGRMLKRDEAEFPLKQEELDRALDPALNVVTRAGQPLSRETLLRGIRALRPEFNIRRNVMGDYSDRMELAERTTGRPFSVERPQRFDSRSLEFSPYSPGFERLWTTGIRGGRGDKFYADFEESATKLYDRSAPASVEKNNQGHFGPSTLSWTRASTHDTPAGRVRVVDEIQSDVHQQARRPMGSPREFMDDEQRELLNDLSDTKAHVLEYADGLQRRINYASDPAERHRLGQERINLMSQIHAADLKIGELEASVNVPERGYWTQADEERLNDLDDFVNNRDRYFPAMDADPEGAKAAFEEQRRLFTRKRHASQDLPFKDAADYGRLELRKGLLDAIDNDDDFLALTPGMLQAKRNNFVDADGNPTDKGRGMMHVYDKVYRGELDKLAKRYGARVVETEIESGGRGFDPRPPIMVDNDYESVGEFLAGTLDALDPYQFANQTDRLIRQLDTGSAVNPTPLAKQAEADLREFRSLAVRLEDDTFARNNPELQETMSAAYSRMGTALHQLWDARVAQERAVRPPLPPEKIKMPAIELTPEVKERIKRIGVPLWSMAGGIPMLDALDADEEAQRYAKGGRVRTALQDLKEYANSLAPQRGFFSTLDELVQQAPFEKAPAEQWRGYLKPGRMLKREGLEFPLKQEELDYALEDALGMIERGEFSGTPNASPSREELLDAVRRTRPEFNLQVQDSDLVDLADGRDEMGSALPSQSTLEQFTDPELTGGGRRFHIAKPDYGPGSEVDPGARLSHSSPGSGYRESITRLRGLGAPQGQHFGPETLSHSRASAHEVPGVGKVRLVEELQSDLHGTAAERMPLSHQQTVEYMTPEERAEYHRLLFNSPAELPMTSIDELRERARARAPRRGYRSQEDTDWYNEQPEKVDGYRPDDVHERIQRYERAVPDAPFKDPADYGRLELRKQLLDAVNADEDYLAMVRGDDQIERYGMVSDDYENASDAPTLSKEAEGMRYVYDKVYRGELERLAKRYGAEVVELPMNVGSQADARPAIMRDLEVETSDDMIDQLGDMLTGEWEIQGEDAIDVQIRGQEIGHALLGELHERLPGEADLVRRLADQWEQVTSMYQQGKVDNDLARATLHQMQDLLDDVLKMPSTESKTKTFPAIKLTPKVKELVRRAGVPLWSIAGGAAVLESLEDGGAPQEYAEGGQVEDERREGSMADYLKTGYRTQWMGLDDEDRLRSAIYHDREAPQEEWTWSQEAGQYLPPQRGVTPGIVHDTIGLPALYDDVRELLGYEPSGVRDWGPVKRASERSGRLEEEILEDADILPPRGVLQGAAYGAGMVGAQLPVPGSAAKGFLRRALTSPLEFFSPIITPSVGSYAAGAGFGAALGLPATVSDHLADASYDNYERSMSERASLEGGHPYIKLMNALEGLPEDEFELLMAEIERRLDDAE